VAILLTGATGFVIASLARHLAALGEDVIAADLVAPDAALRAYLAPLPGRVTFRDVDVTDAGAMERLMADTRPTRLVHGAAITAIPEDVERERFLRTTAVNVGGTLTVLEAARRAGVGRIVIVSSGSIYGPRPDLAPITEDDPARPERLYPLTKWAAEALGRRYGEAHGLDLAVVRLASPFGPFERDTGSRPLLSPIQTWSVAALRGETLRVSGSDTLPRDAVYVDDVASGIAAVVRAERLPHPVYNVGWGRGASARDVMAALGRLVPGVKVDYRPDDPSPWSVSAPRGPLSIERLRTDLGWTPRYDLDSGLAAYLAWLRG